MAEIWINTKLINIHRSQKTLKISKYNINYPEKEYQEMHGNYIIANYLITKYLNKWKKKLFIYKRNLIYNQYNFLWRWPIAMNSLYSWNYSLTLQGAGVSPTWGWSKSSFMLFLKEGNPSYKMLLTGSKYIVPSRSYRISKSWKYR